MLAIYGIRWGTTRMASYSIPRLTDDAYRAIVEKAKKARSRKLAILRNRGETNLEETELHIPIEDRADTNAVIPTEDEIEQRKREVQARWSDEERLKRAGIYAPEEVSMGCFPVSDAYNGVARRRPKHSSSF